VTLLYLSQLNVFYGANHAVRDLDLQVEQGEIVGLIGANGAGKSTTMMSIMGAVKARSGAVVFDGRNITGLPPEQILRMGIAPVMEGRRIFPSLTVGENLRMGAVKARSGAVVFDGRNITGLPPEQILRMGIAPVMEGRRIFPSLTVGENLRMGAATMSDKAQVAQDIDRWCDFFPILRERIDRPAGNLSGGQQQMLAVARALMSRPRLLLMDEPSLGLAPLLVSEIFKLTSELRDLGMTILIVEQNVRMTLNIADRAYLLNLGRVEFSGTPDQIRAEADIERTYLGGQAAKSTVPSTAS
jgi:branched-chain amino acid transport system ATP-binding protein